MTQWTDANLSRLRQLRNAGKTNSQLATAFQTSRSSIENAISDYFYAKEKRWQPVSEAMRQRIFRLYRNGLSQLEIAKQLHRRLPQVAHVIQAHRATLGYRTKEQLNAIQVCAHAAKSESMLEPELALERRAVEQKFSAVRRIVFVSDLHSPFHHAEVVKQVFAEQADLLILGGDTIDSYSISRFRKEKHVSLQYELRDAAQLMVAFSERFPAVLTLMGNHDIRLWKSVQDQLSSEVAKELKGATNLIAKITQGLPNVTVMEGWWARVGKVLFAHRERYRALVGRSGDDGIEYFMRLGIDFDAVVLGHLHRMDGPRPHLRKWSIENGCATWRPDYTYRADSLNAEFQCGYSVIQLDAQGRFEVGASKPIFVAWE